MNRCLHNLKLKLKYGVYASGACIILNLNLSTGYMLPVLAWLRVGVSIIRRVLFFSWINSLQLLQLRFLLVLGCCFFFNSYRFLINVFYMQKAGICKHMRICTSKVGLSFKYILSEVYPSLIP